MSFMTNILFALFAALWVGCAGQPALPSPPAAAAPAPAGPPPEYQLGRGDVVEAKFFTNERFNETVTVRPDGRITLERVGDIYAAGMTPTALDSLITTAYASILHDPEVTVFVRQVGGDRVYVLGEVNAPGGYPVVRDMTVLQSIAAAGGTRRGARLGSVVVLREGAEDGVLLLDLEKYLANGNGRPLSADLQVQPHDIVYVPKTTFHSFNDYMVALWDGSLRPVELLLNAAAFGAFRQ